MHEGADPHYPHENDGQQDKAESHPKYLLYLIHLLSIVSLHGGVLGLLFDVEGETESGSDTYCSEHDAANDNA